MTETQKIIKAFAIALAVFLIVAIFGGIFMSLSFISAVFTDSDDVVVSEVSDYTLGDVNRLYIDMQAADLEIRRGSVFSLETNHDYLDVEESSGSLRLRETRRSWKITDKGYKVVLTVPEKTVFDSVTINTDAGRLTLNDFSTKMLKLSVGAGEVVINNVTSTDKTDFEGGAGEVTISGCSFADLDMNIGVGACTMTAALVGDSEIECGVGASDFKFIRTPETDYTISVDKGLGAVTVDGKSVSDEESIGFGENEIEIKCGVGEVDVEFVNG